MRLLARVMCIAAFLGSCFLIVPETASAPESSYPRIGIEIPSVVNNVIEQIVLCTAPTVKQRFPDG